nr:MAG TPA: hypothetical protein [Caudoviricetes sp.]
MPIWPICGPKTQDGGSWRPPKTPSRERKKQ